jgi:endonuclease-8
VPEGHTVHRIALQMTVDLVGHRVAVSSPQGRFAAGAALVDGLVLTSAWALGKHLFMTFRREPDDEASERWLRVHLGLYGAWDFQGVVSPIGDAGSATSMGAPRARRAVRMGDDERTIGGPSDDDDLPPFPPPPVGQVRVRLATAETVADLRGPIACEVLTAEEVATIVAGAGPDPRHDAGPAAEDEFVRRLTSRGSPVGLLLMDQSVVSGIGNVYRAELLFRARLDPHTVGRRVPAEVARSIWRDWVGLLDDGVRTGVMVTRSPLDEAGREVAVADPVERHAVYRRTGEPCRVCGNPVLVEDLGTRRLYWCRVCQV